MTEQRLVFGSVAEAYDANRPGYPDALYDDLVARFASTPVALDIGCGTGRVTVALAARGVVGIGVEPDEAMAAVARRNLAGTGWTVQVSDFERCEVPASSVDLITCGQAWHWIDPDLGLARVAEVLAPGGWLAVFWNRGQWPDAALRADLDAVYAAHAPEMQSSLAGTFPHKGSVLPTEPPPPGFDHAEVREYTHTVRYTTKAWLGLLGTHSDHVLLDPARRASLYEAEAAVIDAYGGAMDIVYRVEVWSGRRARPDR